MQEKSYFKGLENTALKKELFNMGIADIARYSMSLLFSRNTKEIHDLKASMIDIRASLICDLSEINKVISQAIKSNATLICNEYIDYLVYATEKINGSKFDYSKAKPLVDFVNYTANLSSDMDDKIIASELMFSQTKIQGIIGYDMAKSTTIVPIVQSKTNEFINSMKEELSSIAIKSSKVREHIDECAKIIEACDFSIWYLLKSKTKNGDQPSILERNYDTIMSSLCAEYIVWKESVSK